MKDNTQRPSGITSFGAADFAGSWRRLVNSRSFAMNVVDSSSARSSALAALLCGQGRKKKKRRKYKKGKNVEQQLFVLDAISFAGPPNRSLVAAEAAAGRWQ